MKRTIVSTSLTLAVAGFVGVGAALAQQSYAPGTTPPAPAATPATPDAKATTAPQITAPQSAPGRTESGQSAFTKLDMKQRGYLNAEDVSKLEGFNFKNADKNGDGKLDAAEFNAAWATYAGTPK